MSPQNKPSHARLVASAGRKNSGLTELAKIAPNGLDIGLDILDHLAKSSIPATRNSVAAALNVTPSVVYRSMMVLERHGYIARTGPSGSYAPTAKLQKLQSAAPGHQRLLTLARPVMEAFSASVSQSCNLAISSIPDLLVVANQDSPGSFGITVPVGFRYDIPASAPGLAFAAFSRNSDPARWPTSVSSVVDANTWSTLKKAIQKAADAGYAQMENPYLPDITDLSCPIFEGGQFVAILTMPYLKSNCSANRTWCLTALQLAAEQLTQSLRGNALVA